jgi:trk system potassium uptake protein TrkA
METSAIVGKPLRSVGVPKGALVAAVMRKEQIIIPSGETVVEPDDRIIIVARREAISQVEKILTVKLEFF